MPTIDEIRRSNLERLIAEAGGNRAFADRAGVSESQLSQWVRGATHSVTGKPRGMRTETAQRLERAGGKPAGWMDQEHHTVGEPPAAYVVSIAERQPFGLEQALEVLGTALSQDLPPDVREDVADALAKMARRNGSTRDQVVVALLLSTATDTITKRAA